MAKAMINLFLVLSLIFIFCVDEGKGHGASKPPRGTPTCVSVYGVKSGDSCLELAPKFKLTKEFFAALNPNLNCRRLFVGQWLCVDGNFK